MPKILVTGGAGFIGSALVRHLVNERQATVINVDKLTYAGNLDSLASVMGNPLHVFVHADICDAATMARVFAEHEPEAVMNLAAESHVDRSIDGPAPFIQTNVVGTFTLLEAARNHWAGLSSDRRDAFRFLHVSTDEVFGSLGATGKFDERTSYRPSSPYSASKASADHLVRAWHHTYGLPTMVSNCSNNFGPYQYPEKFIPLMILNAIGGMRLPVYGRGDNVRDWLYVEDHVAALLAVLELGRVGETYTIGGDSERSNLEVVKAVCDELDRCAPERRQGCVSYEELIEHVEDRPGHDARYAIDASKVKSELGWVPGCTFDVGLRRTIAWYLENRDWCRGVYERGAKRERLGRLRKTL